jgi:hypothetical protein
MSENAETIAQTVALSELREQLRVALERIDELERELEAWRRGRADKRLSRALKRPQPKPPSRKRYGLAATSSGGTCCATCCVFRLGHAAGRRRAVFVWVAVFVALLIVLAVIYYLVRVRRHPEEETRPPQ